jgi:hypothetical protein
MLEEDQIRGVFKLLELETEAERQSILAQGLPEPPPEPQTIYRIISDNTTELKATGESVDGELE